MNKIMKTIENKEINWTKIIKEGILKESQRLDIKALKAKKV